MVMHVSRWHVGVAAIIVLTATLAFAAPTPTPLSYSTTFTDPSATPHSVSFTGTASGTSLTGTLTVNGAAEQVTATIGTDGSVSARCSTRMARSTVSFGDSRMANAASRAASI